ncbi:MAG TPA: hypothetical protein VGH73_20475 [Thermoanaerobaculia bacterium]
MRAFSRAYGALCIVCLLAAPAAATTYQKVGDADLADQATVIAEARAGAPIEGAGTSAAPGLPATDYPFTVERAIRGAASGDRLTVRVPGGRRADGMALRIWGAPRFVPGERALLFLAPNADGSFHVLHLMLGAFHETESGDGRAVAVRDLSEAREVGGDTADPPRDLAAFRAWLADRTAGVRRAPDYVLAGSPDGAARNLQEKFNLLSSGDIHIRWFVFDQGGSVAWAADGSGQPGVPGGGFAEFQRALAAWNAEPTTPIHYAYIGQTNAGGGLSRFDGVNAIQFDQPVADPFDCDRGGILAVGGPWYDTRQRATWGGEAFIPITGADIVTNAGIGCYLSRSVDPPKTAEEIFGHELGHTLGLGHSCGDAASGGCAGHPAGDDALMRAYLHSDGRGARLADDDRTALQALYRPGGGQALGPPAAPTNLSVEAAGLTANLLWEDRSGDEEGFRVYRRTGNGRLARIAELPAGTTVYADRGLTPGSRYEYQVATFNARGESRGPRVALATPAALPLQALSLASQGVTARTGTPVAFSVSFSGPAKQARWEFSGDSPAGSPSGVELSDAPCAAQSFCASHVFTQPGDSTVTVRLLGDLGQASERTLRIHVEGPALTPGDGESLLSNVISAPLGGAVLHSDLWLANDGDSPTLVRATFQPRFGALAAVSPVSRDLTLAPGTTLLLPDVLQELFGTGGQGSLTLSYLQTSAAGSGPRVLAFSRARSGPAASAMGSFGPLLYEEPAAGWSAGEKVLAGLPCGDGTAVSLLLQNLDATSGQITVDLFDSLGQAVGGSALVDLGPGAARSQRLDGLFPGLGSHTGPFSAQIQSNGIRFSAAATLLGGELQTPLFLAAKPAGPDGESQGALLIPRVSRGAGAFNTFQFSRLLAANPSSQPRELLCTLWLRGQDGRASRRVATLTIPPQGSIRVEDVLHDLFGLSDGLGALWITWSGPAGPAPRVLSLAVSTAPGGAGSRFAALVDGRGSEEAATARSVDFGAEPSTFVRPSWGSINLGGAPAVLRLSLRNPSGEVAGTAQVTLRPSQPFERALSALFPQAADGGRWTLATEVLGGGPVQTYLFQTGAGGDVSFVPGSAE